MTKHIALITLLFLLSSCNKKVNNDLATAQETVQETPFLSTEYIKTKTSYFTIDTNYNIVGDGKEVIQGFINNSQFIVYGEMHNSKQTSIITKAFMPLLKQANFNTLQDGGETAKPIPFFTGISDAEFLEAARKNGMQLWGLDQEFYYATFFLLDELLKAARDNSNFEYIKTLKTKAHDAITQHFIKEQTDDNYETYKNVLKDTIVLNFFNSFNASNAKAQQIIADLKLSWDIYVRWRDDSRNNFMKHYTNASSTEKLPKVFTKIGSLHAPKIVSNGAYDVGHLTEQLAQKNGTLSTNINSWKPYVIENDTLINNLERYKRGYRRYKLFTDLADKEQWAIINLKSIREALKKGSVKLPNNGDYHKLKRLIEGYDYQIILPIDEDIVLNME